MDRRKKDGNRINSIVFDPAEQPGYRSRYASLDGLMGPRITEHKEKSTIGKFFGEVENPYHKYKSLQNPKLKPQVLLRRKGFNPY